MEYLLSISSAPALEATVSVCVPMGMGTRSSAFSWVRYIGPSLLFPASFGAIALPVIEKGTAFPMTRSIVNFDLPPGANGRWVKVFCN